MSRMFHLVLYNISFSATDKVFLFSSLYDIVIEIPFLRLIAAFIFWSANIGIQIVGTPKYTVSIVLINPQWEIKAFTFGCPETKNKFHNLGTALDTRKRRFVEQNYIHRT